LPQDPLLIWNYSVIALFTAVAGTAFYIKHRKLDEDEDRLNMLPKGVLASGAADDRA
jgi:proton-dependent oligopeptide transporter, POT family